jgi:hypothetical protein
MPHKPWPLDFEALKYSLEALPGIAAPLAPPIEPLPEDAQRAVKELLEAQAVSVHPVVVIIPTELGVQPRKQPSEPPMAILLAPLGEALQGSPQLSARRAPLQMRFPRSVLPPAKLTPQELKTSLSRGLLAAEGEDTSLLGR